jgi:hypothetical protein
VYLLTRNSRIEEDLIDQLFNSSEKRLARLLLLLANFGKEGKPEPIVGNFSQETLAEMLNCTMTRHTLLTGWSLVRIRHPELTHQRSQAAWWVVGSFE